MALICLEAGDLPLERVELPFEAGDLPLDPLNLTGKVAELLAELLETLYDFCTVRDKTRRDAAEVGVRQRRCRGLVAER